MFYCSFLFSFLIHNTLLFFTFLFIRLILSWIEIENANLTKFEYTERVLFLVLIHIVNFVPINLLATYSWNNDEQRWPSGIII
jgi:hypothetical protein